MAVDNWGNQVTTEFEFALAAFPATFLGAIAGRSVGYVVAATLNTPVAVRATTFAQQSSQAQRSIVSTSASDAPAGTGALTVTINYLDSSMVSHSETVTLNGITAVNTVGTNIQFIESIVVATCGSNLANVGTINLMTATAGGGSIMAAIAISDNSTFYAHHYVPAGVTCFIRKHTGSGTLASGRSYMVVMGDPRATNLPILQAGDIIIHLAGGSEDHEYETPIVVTGPNLIVMRENPVATAAGNLAYTSMDWVQF